MAIQYKSKATSANLNANLASTTDNNTLSGTQTVNGSIVSNGNNTFNGSNAFAGTTTAPTQGASDNSTKVATTAFVKSISGDPSAITQDSTHRFATDAEKATWNAKQAALGFTPENAANKGAANGYAPLDSTSKIASAYLPSYVDDVLEFAGLSSFPSVGETGKIYVADNTAKIYRWSGSVYVEIAPSPGSTDSVTEGATNLYFTALRAIASVLSGFAAGAGTVSASDSILTALQKIVGNLAVTVANLSAHTGANTGVHGVTGNVVGTTDAQTLSNKTLTAPVADILALTDQAGSPANPASGLHKVYIKTDGKAYILDSTGSETALGSGSGGALNFITNPDAESNLNGYTLYKDAVSAAPVNGAGTGINVISLSRSTTNPLQGNASFLLSKGSAANAQGEGVAVPFVITNATKAKSVQVSFDYLVASGTFTAGSPGVLSDIVVWIYDVTNSQLIQPSSYTLTSASSTVPARFSGTFQTNSNSTSYRLLFHVATNAFPAYALQFDNVSVSPSIAVYGSPVTDSKAYSITVGGTTTAPTPGNIVTNQAVWSRIGDMMELRYTYTHNSAGGAGSGLYLFPLPSGYSIDTTKATLATAPGTATAINSGATIVGVGNIASNTSGNSSSVSPTVVSIYNATNLAMHFGNSNAAVAQESYPVGSTATPNFSSNPLYLSFTARVPILGWSSNVQMSSDSGQAKNILTTSGTAPATTAGNPIIFGGVTNSTDGLYNSTTGQYPAPVSDFYTVSFAINTNSIVSGSTFKVYVGGVAGPDIGYGLGASNQAWGTVIVKANATQTIDVRCVGSSVGASSSASLSISRNTNPQTIAASDSVNARYSGLPTGTIGTSFAASTNITLPTKNKDTSGAWDGTTFKSPAPGMYSFKGQLWVTGTYTTSTYLTAALVVNGAEVAEYTVNAGAQYISFSDEYPLFSSDQVTFRVMSNATSPTFAGTALTSHIAIARIGN